MISPSQKRYVCSRAFKAGEPSLNTAVFYKSSSQLFSFSSSEAAVREMRTSMEVSATISTFYLMRTGLLFSPIISMRMILFVAARWAAMLLRLLWYWLDSLSSSLSLADERSTLDRWIILRSSPVPPLLWLVDELPA